MQYWTRISHFYLSGLNFDPMPYLNGVSTNSVLLFNAGVLSFPSTPGMASGITRIPDVRTPVNYFIKPSQDTVSLRIDIKMNFNNEAYQPPTSAQLFGHFLFGLNISGIV